MTEFEFRPAKNQFIESQELLTDIERVSKKIRTLRLTQKIYQEHGKYDVTTISRRFGSWQKALDAVGLQPGNIVNYSELELFENILNIWQHKGKQPVRRDLSLPPSKISQTPYNRRFKSWSQTLQNFVEYANNAEEIQVSIKGSSSPSLKQSSRDPSLRLRFKVLKRDNFCCIQCGSSPAKDQNVELHVDHIIPWSKGGETSVDNLQTLCLKCNLGKSDLM